MFFDRQVIKAAQRAKMKYLNRAGAMVRLTAQRLQRYRKQSSASGEAPSAHKPNALLRKLTLYGYDASTDSAVVGPMKLNGTNTGTAPHTLEFGGDIKVEEVRLSGGLWLRKSLVPLSARTGATRTRTVRIEPRPYMGPALAANIPKLPALWANSIKV